MKQKSSFELLKKVSRFILKLLGWKATGVLPESSRYVMIGYPHTSNWDLVIGLLVMTSLGIKLQWIGKKSLFKPPMGWLIRLLGGVPVDRLTRSNFVEKAIQQFREQEELVLVLSPEGTRSKTAHWRTGFYYIAHGAKVPVALGFLDYGNKRGGLLAAVNPTGDISSDIALIREYYRGIEGKFPEKVGEIRLRAEKND